MVKVRPLDDRVVIEVLEAEEKTAGGILLPDAAREKPQKGKVTAVGIGKATKTGDRLAMALKVNDIVMFGKYAGSDVKVDGKEVKIMRESEILLRLSGSES